MVKHKWDIITDTCEKCGIERRIKRYATKYTMIVKAKGYEYKIDGKWQDKRPECVE